MCPWSARTPEVISNPSHLTKAIMFRCSIKDSLIAARPKLNSKNRPRAVDGGGCRTSTPCHRGSYCCVRVSRRTAGSFQVCLLSVTSRFTLRMALFWLGSHFTVAVAGPFFRKRRT